VIDAISVEALDSRPLNKEQIKKLCDEGLINVGRLRNGALDESAIDLYLSPEAYKMRNGSVKPSSSYHYSWFLKRHELSRKLPRPKGGIYTLHAKTTYVFKLQERLERELGVAGFHGQATAKSSIGRVDVLARLIVDGMDTYESFDPAGLVRGSGEMYLEITPMTFPVRVKEGISLSQLRFFYGNPEDVRITGKELLETVFPGTENPDGALRVDLTHDSIGGLDVAAFCARRPNSRTLPVALWEARPEPDPCDYWTFVEADKARRLEIQANNFYILRSKERICLSEGIAIYCRAIDETIGEMRIHYAGFVHPRFGTKRSDKKEGTPLIFEVRGHQVNVSLADGERMANLIFYRMSKDSPEDEKKESGKRKTRRKKKRYDDQTLQLSKFFKSWPRKLVKNGDGTVEGKN
jgi:dCTP deaminase